MIVMNFKFSIIVPVYNTEKYLKKCLNSIKNQTYDNFEVKAINMHEADLEGRDIYICEFEQM